MTLNTFIESLKKYSTLNFPVNEVSTFIMESDISKNNLTKYEHFSKKMYTRNRIYKDENFEILGQEYRLLHTPGHTLQHVNYFMPKHNILFSGDTLFNAGCGRMFEGTPQMFWESLSKIKSLPKNTTIYCGHEYTLANIKFALSIDPNNEHLLKLSKWASRQDKEHRPTLPTILEEQLLSNPFLRCDSEHFFEYYKSQDPIEVFAKMRSAKDNFS